MKLKNNTIFNRISALCLAFSIVLCCCAGDTAESAEDTGGFNPELLLNRMGISAVYNENAYITRGDFAALAVEASGNTVLTNDTFFSDVSGEQGRYINTAAALGFVSVNETALFYPDRIIRTEEAVAICIRVLGYEMIMENISYPNSYMVQAASIGIAKNLPLGKSLTGADATAMLYNMLSSEYVEVSMPMELGKTKYSISKNTFMEDKFYIEERTGTITSVCGLTLNGEAAADGKHIIIGGITYKNPYYSSPDCYINLGQNVRYYTRTTDEHTEVLYLYNTEGILEIDSNDIASVKGFDRGDSEAPLLTYSQEGSSALKKAKLDSLATVFINGAASVSVKNSDFLPENGKIYLTDSNNDGVYDVISIEKYVYYKVKRFEDYDSVITDEYDKQPIRLSDFSEDLVCIMSGGQVADEIIAAPGTVFEVMCSFKSDGSIDTNNYIRLRLMSGVIKGELESVSDTHFYIDGKPYRVISELRDKLKGRIGQTGTFFLGSDDLIIAYKEFDVNDGLDYGYLVAVGTEGGMRLEYKFRIYTMQGKMIDCEPSETFCYSGERNGKYVDSVTLRNDDIEKMVNEGKLESQMIKYTLDDEGRLAMLQTAVDHTDEADYVGFDDDYFSLDYKSDTARKDDRYMENGYYFDNRTIVIYATTGSTSAEDFDIGGYLLYGPTPQAGAKIEIYDSPDTLNVTYAVFKDANPIKNNGGGGSMFFNTSRTWLIKGKTSVLDEDGNAVTRLSLMRGDTPSELTVVSDDLAPLNTSYGGTRNNATADGGVASTGEYGVPTNIQKISDLEPGDIISVNTNSRGKIIGYVVLHEYDSAHNFETDEVYQDHDSRAWKADFRRTIGRVTQFVPESTMKLDVTGDTRFCIGRTAPVYMIYNKARNTIEVPKDRINLNVGDYVWVYTNYTNVQMVVKYVND